MLTISTLNTLMGRMTSRMIVPVLLLVATLGLSGCYTQLAVLERPHGDLDQVVADYGDDGDILVRRYYEDGYVEEEVYTEYDWYHHRPFTYARYFDSFYGPSVGVSAHCWDIFYCDPYWGHGSSFSISMGFGSWGYWNRPYTSVGFGWGYDPFYWGSYYRPYSHFPAYAWYGSPGYYYHGGVGVASGRYAPRGETMARSALTSRTRGSRGGRDEYGIAGGRSTLGSSASSLGTRTVVSSGRSGTTASKGLATGTRPSRGTLTGDRSARTTVGSTRNTTRSSVGTSGSTSRTSGWDRSATRTTRSSVGTRTTRSSSGTRATTRTSRTSGSGSRAVPSRTTSRTGSSVGRTSNTRSRSSGVSRSTGNSSRSSGASRSTGSSSRSSGVSRSTGSSSRSSGVSSSSGSSSRSSGARSSGSSSSSSRSSGSSSRKGRNN